MENDNSENIFRKIIDATMYIIFIISNLILLAFQFPTPIKPKPIPTPVLNPITKPQVLISFKLLNQYHNTLQDIHPFRMTLLTKQYVLFQFYLIAFKSKLFK